jgi:hypothetical protein
VDWFNAKRTQDLPLWKFWTIKGLWSWIIPWEMWQNGSWIVFFLIFS